MDEGDRGGGGGGGEEAGERGAGEVRQVTGEGHERAAARPPEGRDQAAEGAGVRPRVGDDLAPEEGVGLEVAHEHHLEPERAEQRGGMLDEGLAPGTAQKPLRKAAHAPRPSAHQDGPEPAAHRAAAAWRGAPGGGKAGIRGPRGGGARPACPRRGG
jgi:hypothetical protein